MSFPAFAAKFFLNDFRGLCRKYHLRERELMPPAVLGALVGAVWSGVITRHDLKAALIERAKELAP